jgi:hypothetical protein
MTVQYDSVSHSNGFEHQISRVVITLKIKSVLLDTEDLTERDALS